MEAGGRFMLKKHALLSASSAYKWLEHPPISRLEEVARDDYGVDDTNEAAEEGTAAHALAEFKLRQALGETMNRPMSAYQDEDMETFTDDYSQFIQELIQEHDYQEVLIEQRLDFSNYVPDGFGTGDCVLVKDNKIHVIDFKYGRYFVQAESNPQMMLYGLGALNMFDGIYDIQEVFMTIYQPRIGNITTWVIDKDTLLEWANKELKPKAQLAYEGKGDLNPGPWLKLTKLKAISKDRANHLLELRKYDLKEAHLLTDSEIEDILANVDELVDWAKSVKDYVEQQAIQHHKQWHGFKLVESRTRRQYSDEAKVIERAKANQLDIFEQKVLPITKLEKKFGKKQVTDTFGDLITKPTGKPTLVAKIDSRPALNTFNINEDFKGEF